MEQKSKLPRKKSIIDVKNLPIAPDIPTELAQKVKSRPMRSENDPFNLLLNFRERKSTFLDSLNENIKLFDAAEHSLPVDANNADMMSNSANKSMCEDECRDYIEPLLNRTQDSISALMATRDSLDQLDNLHRIVRQLLVVQEQNYLMRKRLRAVKTLQALKSMEIQINGNPEKFIRESLDDASDVDMNELEENMANLENIIAAGTSASNKRNSSKKRSKSIISEDFNFSGVSSARENDRNYPLRRQSAISDFKPKVSKWTKVKAAFKWEKANALPLSESKSSDSVLSPASNEVRYLRVPSTAHAACSSGDSLFSLSSGRVGTPPEISSLANSSADENEDEKTISAKCKKIYEEGRRSFSIDDGNSSPLFGGDKNKNNKSAWSKVKGIVTNRSPRKALKSAGSLNSRDVSPIDMIIIDDRNDSISSSNQPSPSHNVNEIDLIGTSSSCSMHNQGSSGDDNDLRDRRPLKPNWVQKKIPNVTRKFRLVPEIESLPEGIPLESKPRRKFIPNPLNLKQEFSESDGLETFGTNNNSPSVKITRDRKSSSSLPNSPSRAGEFFSENESSGGDYSPLKRDSNNSSTKSTREHEQDEILRNYKALQRKIGDEFERKKVEWEKMRPLVVQLSNSFPSYLKDDLSQPGTPKSVVNNLAFNEENLSADFKKKLSEWRIMKSQQQSPAGAKDTPTTQKKQLDWQLWRTGQVKFDNQGRMALPDTKDLPEDFLKKLNEWKQMKNEGRVPSYTQQSSVQERTRRQFSIAKSSSANSSLKKNSKTSDDKKIKAALATEPVNKEVVVRTSIGTMTFQGISRKFTKKLYKWEKAKGIAPELSTFALLHPEYQALLDDKKSEDREKSPGLKRCLSVDSVKPSPSQVDLIKSHQPSSLSLNDAENFKETEENRRVASNIEIYEHHEEESNEIETPHSEPEAMLVEIEDESCEPLASASTTTPVTQMQIPIFKFDFANRDSRHDPADNLQTIKEILDVYDKANNSILNIYQKNEVSITSIKHLTNIFKYINHSLVQLRESTKEFNSPNLEKALHYSNEIALDFESIDNSFNEVCVEEKLPEINGKNCQLKDSLVNFENYYMQRHINSIESYQAKRTVQSSSEKAVAIVEVTPTFLCNAIKMEDEKLKVCLRASDSENPVTSDVLNDDKMSRKIVSRNTSNGSKRKIRLKRMGSRQSSKTESDSDAETNPDPSRKTKRKSNRSKKTLESDKSFESFQGDDEVVYVFKLKPGEKNEVTVNKAVDSAIIDEEPSVKVKVELPPDEQQPETQVHHNLATNAFVKTRRKIFTPVDIDGDTINATIGREIDSSSASDKNNEIDKKTELSHETIKDRVEIPPELQLIGLASPKMPRKDLSPSIRLMIDRYHFNFDKKSNSPNSSGSCSPIWRSPILDRRVRKQSVEYQNKISGISQSNSANDIKEVEQEQTEVNNNETNDEVVVEEIQEFKEVVEEPICEQIKVPEIQSSVSTGAISKRIESPHLTIPSTFEAGLASSLSSVTLRGDPDKPRTPLSERALKIQRAKEAFLQMPPVSYDPNASDWGYRLSQISVGSTDTSDAGSLIKCLSARTLNDHKDDTQDDTSDNKSLSLPRSSNASSIKEGVKNSRFGLSTLTSKLRKVKLKKKDASESSKMNTIPILCRQSLAVDFSTSNAESSDSATVVTKATGKSRFKKNNNIKKSKSLGLLE